MTLPKVFKADLLMKIVVTLLLLFALFFLTKVGVADFLRLAPCAYIDAVHKGSERVKPTELLESRERLLLARSWDSSNPLIPEYLGQIAIIRAQLISFSPFIQSKFLRDAISEFETAIELRPNSAYLWADRVTAGSALLEANAKQVSDAEMIPQELIAISHAYLRASELGPWEPKVLSQLVRVGTLRYKEFTPEVKKLVDDAITRANKLSIKV